MCDPLRNSKVCLRCKAGTYIFPMLLYSEKTMAPHSITLAWKIPWTEEPGGLQSMGSKLNDFPFTFHFHTLEKEMATHSSVLAWRIPGTGKPGRLPSIGSHRVRYDWSDLAAAAACFFIKNYFSLISCKCKVYSVLINILLSHATHQQMNNSKCRISVTTSFSFGSKHCSKNIHLITWSLSSL